MLFQEERTGSREGEGTREARELSQAGCLPSGKNTKIYAQPVHHPGNTHYTCKRNKNIIFLYYIIFLKAAPG